MYALLLFTFLFFGGNDTVVKGEETVTIRVVEGKSYLVHVDAAGNVLHMYMEIKETKNLDTDLLAQVEQAKKDYESIREREKDQIRFIAYDFISDVAEPLAMAHLQDLANHYNNSYANQIVITLGKRPGNEEYLKEKENVLVAALTYLQIPIQNIEVKYKWDRGPEPTAFIKVNTTLRELLTI
ncbi:MAG: hypothetical protein V3V00_07315 [Saprospiraceae bacterium]